MPSTFLYESYASVQSIQYYVFTAVFTLDAGLLAISQYLEGPATGHPDTGFSCFPCVYKQMLRWFPRLRNWFYCRISLC